RRRNWSTNNMSWISSAKPSSLSAGKEGLRKPCSHLENRQAASQLGRRSHLQPGQKMLREGCALCLVFLLERSEWRVPDRTFLRPACRRHHGQGPEHEARTSPCLPG